MTEPKRSTLSSLTRHAARVVLGVPQQYTPEAVRTALTDLSGLPDITTLLDTDLVLEDPYRNRLLTAARLLLDESTGVGHTVLPFLKADAHMPESRRMFTEPPARADTTGQLALAI